MLVRDRVADGDDRALADGEMVEVGAGVELDLVGDDAAVPWPAGALAAVTVSTAPLSTSVSLASTSTAASTFSLALSVSRWRPGRRWCR